MAITSQEGNSQGKRKITLQLSHELVEQLDRLRSEWGLRSRGDTVERLIGDLFIDPEKGEDNESSEQGQQLGASTLFDEGGALVLVAQHRDGVLGADFVDGSGTSSANRAAGSGTGAGIDLPGFVRKQSDQLRQSLQPLQPREARTQELIPLVAQNNLNEALQAADQHWLQLYGTSPNEHVLEACMQWLAKDIWPQSDLSEAKAFTWSLASRIAHDLAPSWPAGQPSFASVMALAGLLEDPFSSATLSMRIPTLIRRFVHRMRRRQRGMSFETLENTMSLHGALKLLQLPTAPGHRLTLADIRDAYKEQALQHHPDSGGNPEQMRRLNEAYQLLKELYRAA
ncbi:MAG: DnaJ domain-containing protein [Cyanobacteriota bacterium]|nr:DnaJ domain-containing protein [Cyanobacteriota bacterium]